MVANCLTAALKRKRYGFESPLKRQLLCSDIEHCVLQSELLITND